MQNSSDLAKRAHSCHVNIDTRRFGHIKVDLQISADASEPVLGTSFGCAQVWVDFWSLNPVELYILRFVVIFSNYFLQNLALRISE